MKIPTILGASILREMRLSILIVFINLVATHSTSPPELYWKSLLPTTPIPKPILVLIHSDGLYRTVNNGKTVNRTTNRFEGGMPPRFRFDYGGYYNLRFGRTPHSETKLQDKPETDLFFLQKDLKLDRKMNFHFTHFSNNASFLPREVVKSIPFSSNKMAEILNKFAVRPGSINAKVMMNTVKDCERSGIKGEEKYCATSLESMLDFTILKLGKNVEAFCTEVNKVETMKQEYTITNEVKEVGETKVVCHKMSYVYAVFYCHKIMNTVAYTVSLEGADGTKVKAVSVCHKNTSEWNPKHLAFQMLGVKPGTVPVCHFLFQDTIAWVPKQN